MPSFDQCIIQASRDSWEEEFLTGTKNKNNCSGFVKAVARKLGIPLAATLNADGIAAHVAANWLPIASGAQAAQEADKGMLVLAVLKGGDHRPSRNNGHVAIVVSGSLYRGAYPMMWGGSIGGAQSPGTKSVGEVWNRTDRDLVKYYAYSAQACRP